MISPEITFPWGTRNVGRGECQSSQRLDWALPHNRRDELTSPGGLQASGSFPKWFPRLRGNLVGTVSPETVPAWRETDEGRRRMANAGREGSPEPSLPSTLPDDWWLRTVERLLERGRAGLKPAQPNDCWKEGKLPNRQLSWRVPIYKTVKLSLAHWTCIPCTYTVKHVKHVFYVFYSKSLKSAIVLGSSFYKKRHF